jgi:cyclic-di-GMP-binding protein
MTAFELPAVSADAAPEFTSASGCAKWLQTVPLINVGPAHERLLEQLDELNTFQLAPGERLKILELLREPVGFVLKENSKKFSNRPAPLAPAEREMLKNVYALWDAFATGYLHCLQAVAERAAGLSPALIGQRILWCTGQKIVACYAAYQDVGEDDWNLLHRVFALVEERGRTKEEIGHPEHKGKETTCTETYAQVLLLDLANPGKLTPRQIELISGWLERWTRKVSVGRGQPEAVEGVPPLLVDLSRAGGASRRPAETEGASIRFLDISDLRGDLRKRIALLKKGETPGELGLGEDVTPQLAEGLLGMVYRRWCEDQQSRAHPRHEASGNAATCVSLPAIHYYVTGRAFVKGGAKQMSRKEHDELATLGRLATRHEDLTSLTPDFPVETWQIKDESASGLRLERVDPAATSRLMLGQLLGIQLANAKAFLLCTIKWLSVSTEFGLRIGVQILPGVPQGIGIKQAGPNPDPYTQGFLLPAFAPLKAPETLVTPAGWFKAKRELEVADRPGKVRLIELIDRGADYERVSFESA